MKAMQLVGFGDHPEFEMRDVPAPVAGPGQVVVAIKTAALNRRDPWIWQTEGYCSLPVTMGSDGAGTVVELGDGATEVDLGDEVVIYPTLGWRAGETVPGPDFDILGAPTPGTFAQRVAVDASSIAPRPARLSWVESAALPLAGLTAWRALFTCAKVAPGDRVLVTGAGGGVATMAVQLAVAAGASVVTTTGTPEKARRCREIGALASVLYRSAEWPAEVLEAAGGPLDIVVDSFGGPSWARALPLLRRGGTFVSYGDTSGPSAEIEVADVYWQWRSILGTSMGSPEEFAALLDHVARTQWRPVVDEVFPLHELARAAARIGAPDRFGKVVLSLDGLP